MDFDLETAFKVSTGGGLRKGEVCGAVTGALMSLGLIYGHSIDEALLLEEKGLKAIVCPKVIKDAIEILENMIKENTM